MKKIIFECKRPRSPCERLFPTDCIWQKNKWFSELWALSSRGSFCLDQNKLDIIVNYKYNLHCNPCYLRLLPFSSCVVCVCVCNGTSTWPTKTICFVNNVTVFHVYLQVLPYWILLVNIAPFSSFRGYAWYQVENIIFPWAALNLALGRLMPQLNLL